MRTKTQIIAVAAASLFAVTLFAGGLSKYKGWDKSPQGDLMTADERAQWANVRTDDEADKFVKDFLAKRSPEVLAEVDKAASNADKYLSVGKVKGSTTERGKVVILLGPPSSLQLSEKQVKGDTRMNVDSAMTVSGASTGGGGGGGQGASVTDMMNAANGPGSGGGGTVRFYTFTYTADKLPAAYGKSLTIEFDLDSSGTDHVADRKMQVELDRLYEMVAQAKLSSSASSTQH